MRVMVDQNVCEGHGQCMAFAPEIFQLDDNLVVHYPESPDEALRRQVEAAVDACPTRAITVTKWETEDRQ